MHIAKKKNHTNEESIFLYIRKKGMIGILTIFLVVSTYNMQFEKISHVANTIHFLKKNASNNGDI